MNIIGLKVRVIISDPWDMFNVITGKIILYFSDNEESYFVVEGVDTTINYFISTRYCGEKLTDIFNRRVSVAIAILENLDLEFDTPDYGKSIKYIGIGSIELFKENS